MKYVEKVFHTVVLSCTIGFYSALAFAGESNNVMGITENHYKTVIKQQPYTVEVCKEVAVSGDKTGDTLKGAIIGGIIGHQIDHNKGSEIGAVLGGAIGHSNSNATGGYRTQCQTERRYNEERVQVYSHSTITFWDGGREYTVKFKR